MIEIVFFLLITVVVTIVFFMEVFHDQRPVWILILGSVAVWDWYTLINQIMIMNGGT